MRVLASSMRPSACLLIAAMIASAAPARGADDPGTAARPAATLAATATAVVARMDTVPDAALQEGAAPTTTASDEGVLGTNRGRIAAVLFVAGLVVTIVSRNKDAVHSPAR